MRLLKSTDNPIYKFRFHSLLLKYFCTIIVIILLPVILLGFIYSGYYSRTLLLEVEKSNENAAIKVRDMFDMVISEAYQIVQQACLDEDLVQFASEREKVFNDNYSIQRYKSIVSGYAFRTLTSDVIHSISVYSIPNDYYFSVPVKLPAEFLVYGNDWEGLLNEILQIEPGRRIIKPANVKQNFIISVFGVAPIIRNDKNAIVSVNLNVTDLINLTTVIEPEKFEEVVVYDSNNDIILDSSDGLLGGIEHLFYEHNLNSMKDDVFSFFYHHEDDSYIVTSLMSAENDLRFIFAQSEETYYQQVNELRLFMSASLIVIILLSFALAYLTAHQVYKPVKAIKHIVLDKTMTKEKFFSTNTTELDFLLSHIEEQSHTSQEIEEELNNRIELLSHAKIATLQSQINPHFLGNVLETVNLMAITSLGIGNRISDVVSSLSKLYRQNLDMTNSFTTLSEEINSMSLYVKIQELRYENKFSVIINRDTVSNECLVLKMMLQPIIENSIYHGIKPLLLIDSTYHGQIYLDFSIECENLVILIKDNGKGMSQDEYKYINKKLLSDDIYQSEHIGISNVHQRIKLLFGNQYGIEVIQKSSASGLLTRITIPYIPFESIKD